MSNNPFSSKPTLTDSDSTEDNDDEGLPTKVKEDYDRVPPGGNGVEDPEDKADEEWAQTSVDAFAVMDEDRFWWVVVNLEHGFVGEGEHVMIPHIVSRHHDYEEFREERGKQDDPPEGIHVQHVESRRVRYLKGDDEAELLKRRGLQ